MTCPGCGAVLPGPYRFCPFCGAATAVEPPPALHEARKVVSVLFCDVVGSTAAGQRLDPEDVSEVLRIYHRTTRSIIEGHGGLVEKFIGDAVFAVFGVPIVHEDDAERSVRAALAVCDAAAQLPGLAGDVLHVRCGVSTGEVLARIGVPVASGEGFVTGTAANVAARLQGVAPVDGTVVDRQTFNLTQGIFEYTELEPVTVKGIDEPLAVFRPRAPLAPPRGRGRQDRPSPLIGRETELRVLSAAYDEVLASGRAALVVLSGEPGLGKSRLVSAFREHVRTRDPSPVWRIGQSLPYGNGVGVWAFAEILKSHAGILDSDDAATAVAKLDASLSDDPDRDWIRERLLPILGIGSPSSADYEETLSAWVRFIELLAEERPAVVVFEDIHWSDDALLRLLGQIVNGSSAVRLLVIATTRPELFERGGASAHLVRGRVVDLAPLADADVASLAATLLGGAPLSPELEETVLSNAGGNALYAGEFVRLLLDRRALVQAGGAWRLAAGAAISVPDTTQGLIAARVDILPPVQRRLLGDAAVVGATFWADALTAIGDLQLDEVIEALEDLARRHHVSFAPESTLAGEVELRFTHVLVRDGAYAQLTRRERAEKHQAVARWIEQTAGERWVDQVDILAYHTTTALDLLAGRGTGSDALRTSALRYSTLAAERNVTLDTKAAAHHLERALSLSADTGPDRLHLLVLAGQIALQEGRPSRAVELLEGVVVELGQTTDRRATVRAMVPLIAAHTHLGGQRWLELGEEAVALLADGPNCVELVDALSANVGNHVRSGDFRGAIESAERAFAVAAALGIERPTTALAYRGCARFCLGDIGGVDDLREAAALAVLRGGGRAAAMAYLNLLVTEHLVTGPVAALEVCDQAVEFSTKRGLVEMADVTRVFAFEAMLDVGRVQELLTLAADIEGRLGTAGSDYVLVQIRTALLRTWALVGERSRIEESTAWLERACRRTGAPEDLVAGLSACAIGRYAIGHDEAARAVTRELLAQDAGAILTLAVRLPGLVRAAIGAGDAEFAERLVESERHPSPYAFAAVAAARGAIAEFGDDPRGAAVAYIEAAERFADLGVLLEQWLALSGAGRSLAASGDRPGARQAAARAAEVLASMPAGDLLEGAGTNTVTAG